MQTIVGQCGPVRRVKTTYDTVWIEMNRFWCFLVGRTLLWDIWRRSYLLSFQFANTLFETANEPACVNYETKTETKLVCLRDRIRRTVMIFLTQTARVMYSYAITALRQDAIAFLLASVAP
jgi:hypothetical protein